MDKATQYERLIRDRDPQLRAGSLVRLKKLHETAIRDIRPGVVLVCFADKFEKANCTFVGGAASGRYWRIPAHWLEVVDPAEVVLAGEADPEKRFLPARTRRGPRRDPAYA
jgi:hypothetical protein